MASPNGWEINCMTRIVSRHRFAAVTIAVLVLITGGILLKPRIARAFTLLTFTQIYFDPVSVSHDFSAHLHVVNQLGPGPIVIRGVVKPTTAAAGAAVPFGPITLNFGDGIDIPFPWAAFAPTTDRVPVVAVMIVSGPGGTAAPFDFSARIASSVEIVDDKTNKPTELQSSKHVVLASGPCLFCD
jgi:hypothetical protein